MVTFKARQGRARRGSAWQRVAWQAVLAAALVALVAMLSGCQPMDPQQAATGTTEAQSATQGSTAPLVGAPMPSVAGLLIVHDTGHVSGTYKPSCHVTGTDQPDPACTPGAVRDDVNEADISTTVCKPGWTATVRAPESETSRTKAIAMRAYGITASPKDVELDHFVPIELGGANSTTNLWPQVSDEPGHGFENTKDQVETALKRAVCNHQVQLLDAQKAIAANWHTAEQVVGIK